MNLVGTYIWKEWREQRVALGFLALGLATVTAVLATVLPREDWSWAGVYDTVVAASLGATLLTVGSDLLPRDLRHEPRLFLERAPAGLRAAFLAKGIFFIALLVGAVAFGIHLASAAAWIRTGDLPNGLFEVESLGQVLLIAVAVIFWIFAISTWVATSAMTVPSTLILLAVFSWPWWLQGRSLAPLELGSTLSNVLVAMIAVGGLATACWSFVVGASRSRRRFVRVLGGLGIAALFFSPAWAVAGVRYWEWKHSGFYIYDTLVGLGGRYAFVNLGRLDPARPGGFPEGPFRTTALVLDLEDGTWSVAGELDESFALRDREFIRRQAYAGWDGCPRFHVIHTRVSDDDVLSESTGRFIDALSGESIDERRLRPEEWWPGTTPADFGIEAPYRNYNVYWAGLGQRLFVRYPDAPWKMILRDPARGLLVDLGELTSVGGEPRVTSAIILPAGWLARENQDGSGDWIWVDPFTGECTRCEHLEAEEQLWAVLTDGTILAARSGTISRVDLTTGERATLRITEAGAPAGIPDGFRFDLAWKPVPAESCSVHSLSHWQTGRERLALLDPRLNELKLSSIEWTAREGDGFPHVLSTEGSRAIVRDPFRILRCDLAGETTEVIFDIRRFDEDDLEAGSVTR